MSAPLIEPFSQASKYAEFDSVLSLVVGHAPFRSRAD